MFFSSVFLALCANVIACTFLPRLDDGTRNDHVSRSPGLYASVLEADVTYMPRVEECNEDSARRLEILTNFFKATEFAGENQPNNETRMKIEDDGPIEGQLEPRPSRLDDELKDVKILCEVDMGRMWDIQRLTHCESRVGVFGLYTSDIREVLRIMIKFGPIKNAWMLNELKKYGRPNVVFVEYVHIRDAREAVNEARFRFTTRVGVVPSKDEYNRRSNRLKITFEPGSNHLTDVLTFQFLEKSFGIVVDLFRDMETGLAYITFNWVSSAKAAVGFFSAKGCKVSR